MDSRFKPWTVDAKGSRVSREGGVSIEILFSSAAESQVRFSAFYTTYSYARLFDRHRLGTADLETAGERNELPNGQVYSDFNTLLAIPSLTNESALCSPSVAPSELMRRMPRSSSFGLKKLIDSTE